MTSSDIAHPALLIRRATVDDAPAFVQQMSDPAVFANLFGMPYPDVELWRARLAAPKPGAVDLALVGVRDAQVVATAGLHPVGASLRQRHCASLGLSVARSAQRQGVGLAMMRALMDYADNWAQVLRLQLTVFADNAGAIALYEKCGFELEGRHRCDTLRAGRYIDSLTMARLHPSPPSVTPPC